MQPCKVHVVIIGAGAAGLSAGQKLHQKGFRVQIVEALPRIGGRIYSDQVGSGDHSGFIEYGAQWIHGDEHGLYDMVRELGLLFEKRADTLLDEDEATGEFVTSNGKKLSVEDKDAIQDCLMSLNECLVTLENPANFANATLDGTNLGQVIEDNFGEFLKSRGYENEALYKAVYDWFVRYQLNDNGCSTLEELSLRAFSDYSLDGDNTARLMVPMCEFLQHLRAGVPDDQIILNKPVAQVVRNGPAELFPVTVKCVDGQEILAHHVIITVSLGVLKSNLQMFEPMLSDKKRHAIRVAGFGTVGKVLLQFEEPFWENMIPPEDGFQLLWMNEQEERSNEWWRYALGFDVVRTAKNVLVLWIAPPGAMAMEALSDEEVAKDCRKILSTFTEFSSDEIPCRVLREKWGSNPYIRGTYSFISLESSKAGLGPEDLAEPEWYSTCMKSNKEIPLLLFAGEATFPLFWSTIHGAVLSGWREADRLTSLYCSS